MNVLFTHSIAQNKNMLAVSSLNRMQTEGRKYNSTGGSTQEMKGIAY